jgi:hypothetical protein
MKAVTELIWPLVVVGRGSTAAYYVSVIDLTAFGSILAIGDDDSWAGKRGHNGNATDPTLVINQPLHLLAHFDENIPGFSEQLVDRLAWARMNEGVLKKWKVQIHKATVADISESKFPEHLGMVGDLGPFGFKIDLTGDSGKQSVYAYKVVVCAGTGAHRVPAELTKARSKRPQTVLDLDEFAKLTGAELTPEKRVVVIGSNAAIDAVHKALHYDCRIDWLIDLDYPKKPPILATQPKVLAAWNDPSPKNKLKVIRYSEYEFLEAAGARLNLRVTLRGSGKTEQPYGNYIVYGVGPKGETTKIISTQIQAKLKPISDGTGTVSRIAKPLGKESVMAEARTILGWEAEGTGLKKGFEVFGAMSGSIGREIVNSNDRMEVLKKQIEATRSVYSIYTAITTFSGKLKLLLSENPSVLALRERRPLAEDLRKELDLIAQDTSDIKFALEVLANQILAYHTAAAYAALSDKDPSSLKNFRNLLNQVAEGQPKGSVGDHGQLTAINAALGAYATMRGPLPRYMPTQEYGTPGPGKKGADIEFKTIPGDYNFNSGNLQNLAIYVCASFPNIPPGQANAFVDKVLREFHASDVGLTDSQVAAYRSELAAMERTATEQALKKVA